MNIIQSIFVMVFSVIVGLIAVMFIFYVNSPFIALLAIAGCFSYYGFLIKKHESKRKEQEL